MLENMPGNKTYPGRPDEDIELAINDDDELAVPDRGWDSQLAGDEREDPVDAPPYPAWCDEEDDRCPPAPLHRANRPAMEAPTARERSPHGGCRPEDESAFRIESEPRRHPAQGPDDEQARARGSRARGLGPSDYELPGAGRIRPNAADRVQEERYTPLQGSDRSTGGGAKHGPKRDDDRTKKSIPAKENRGGRAQSHGGGRTAQHPREEKQSRD